MSDGGQEMEMMVRSPNPELGGLLEAIRQHGAEAERFWSG